MENDNAANDRPATTPEAPDVDGMGGLVALLADLRPPGGVARADKRRLLDGVARLVGADAWSWALTRTPAPGEPASMPVPLATLDGGWTPAQKAVHVQAQQSPHRRVFGERLMRAFDADGLVCAARPRLLDDAAWRGSDYYRAFVAAMGLDEFLIAARRVNARDVSGVAFYRAAGRPAFDAAAVACAGALMRHVGWLHDDATPAAATDPMTGLSPRERQVLTLIQAGDGYKQVAGKLGISEHTVGGYMKSIYRRFGVSSRGELQAKFLAGHVDEGLRDAGG